MKYLRTVLDCWKQKKNTKMYLKSLFLPLKKFVFVCLDLGSRSGIRIGKKSRIRIKRIRIRNTGRM